MIELVKECVNAHDRCAGTVECPYCEIKMPPRDAITGKFVEYKEIYNDRNA